jgi:hypothetical protein
VTARGHEAPDVTARGHETRDLPPRGILLVIAGVFALIAVAGLGVGLLLHAMAGPPLPNALPAPPRAGPPLLVAPAAERRAVEIRGAARLDGYGWSDRAAGLAHIPIDRAMALVDERGWPDEDAHR